MKLSFIDGTYLKPIGNTEECKQWIRTDSMVFSWIMNLISKDIAKAFSYAKSARSLWLQLEARFGQANGPMIYNLQREIALISQGNMDVDPKTRRLFAVGRMIGKLYVLDDKSFNIDTIKQYSLLKAAECCLHTRINDANLWHRRLGRTPLLVLQHANVLSDNRCELDVCQNNGILHHRSCVYSPQQNGVVERKHKHLLQIARALMFQSHLPSMFWTEAILIATYLINRLPVLNWKTPYEILYGKPVNYTIIRTFGCLAFATNVQPHKSKFTKRAYMCIFVGYAFGQKGNRLYDLEDNVMLVSRDVVFQEGVFPCKNVPSPTDDYPYPVPELDDTLSALFFAIAAARDWHIHQMDINNAFLHGYLEEEIYMSPPDGYSVLTGIVVAQTKYIKDIVADTGITDARTTTTPLPPGIKFTSDAGAELAHPDIYRRLVGRFLYLNFTRPYTSYACQQLIQHLHRPCQQHLDAALHLVRYLKGSVHKGLFFSSHNDFALKAYSDADWASCIDTRKSLTGYCIFLGDALVSWKTKKQNTVSRSTTEAEYRSMGSTVCELSWIEYLLQDFDVFVSTPIPFLCDNQAALYIVNNPIFHERTKHLKIDCHIVWDKFKSGLIAPSHVPSKAQLADIFTKSLLGPLFLLLLAKLGLVNFHPSPTCGGTKELAMSLIMLLLLYLQLSSHLSLLKQ
ncbi:UNVERIFIED_CONTAM: Retrovirus-related Pol polyprotein from transposon RE1 [Sesamum radiatum]|uniref:Retrovirus-related Pol polyprotein from transposon RE1 n=1 Tax=Sesamum radiatum TaxID=300843 RepID=A0AAW2KGJ1_SESRA